MSKIDLHLHLDGSLRPSTIMEWAKSDGLLKFIDNNTIKSLINVDESTQNLNEYLSKFSLPIQVLNSSKRFERVGYEIIEDLYNLGYIYSEIRFAPQLHVNNNLSIQNIIDSTLKGMEKASHDYNFPFGLILCSMRHLSLQKSIEIINIANHYQHKNVVGVDLAGDELNFPPELFSQSFKQSKLPITIHAGEALGANSVLNAIKIGATRIGHGIRAIENKQVIDTILENNIALEICPKSNQDTKVYPKFNQYPIKQLFDLDIPITLNSDNLTVSNTNFDNEVKILKQQFQFSQSNINSMLNNSIQHAFCSDNIKSNLFNLI